MKKRVIISLMAIALAVGAMFAYNVFRSEESAKWTHGTFQGTVTDIWADEDTRYFTLSPHLLKTEHNFIINAETLYVIDFKIGDKVIVESDYNIKEHNGDDVPYPAVMVTDPDVSDKR